MTTNLKDSMMDSMGYPMVGHQRPVSATRTRTAMGNTGHPALYSNHQRPVSAHAATRAHRQAQVPVNPVTTAWGAKPRAVEPVTNNEHKTHEQTFTFGNMNQTKSVISPVYGYPINPPKQGRPPLHGHHKLAGRQATAAASANRDIDELWSANKQLNGRAVADCKQSSFARRIQEMGRKTSSHVDDGITPKILTKGTEYRNRYNTARPQSAYTRADRAATADATRAARFNKKCAQRSSFSLAHEL